MGYWYWSLYNFNFSKETASSPWDHSFGMLFQAHFFVLFGAWWTIQICRKYLKSFSKHGEAFTCQVTYPPNGRCCKVDLEAVVALSAAVTGVLIELVFACGFRGKPIGVTNEQHATMYFSLGFLQFWDF